MTRTGALLTTLLLLVACTSSASPSAAPPPADVSATPGETAAASTEPTAESSEAEVGWRQLSAGGSGPPAREDHTWTLTPDGATAYLFGGRTTDGSALDDLWAYDLAAGSWEEVAAEGPDARFGHDAAWVEGIGLVLFGGQAGDSFFNDLWGFDPSADAWGLLPAAGAVPVARYGSCADIGPDGRLWISHGFTSEGQRFADTRAYDFATGQWTDETPVADRPVERCLHACWWTDDGVFALYAGQTTGIAALGDLWHLTPGERPGLAAWREVGPAGEPPPDRHLYAAARWGPGTLVFGGRDADAGLLNDLWWLDDATGAAEPISVPGSAPEARYAAELIADPDNERLLLFGGRGQDALDDLWELRLPAR